MPSSYDLDNNEHDKDATAKRVVQVDASGDPVTPTTGGATETTLALVKAKTDNLDLAITALRDAIRGTGDKTLTDLLTGIVLAAGNNAIGKLAANSGVDIGDVDVASMPTGASGAQVQGTVADDAADAQNPQKVGAKVKNFDGTDPGSASSEDDRADLTADRNRRLYVNSAHPNFWTVTPAAYSAAQTNASVKAAPGANLSLYITDIFVSNGATAGIITLLDGSGGTVIFRAYCAINGGAVLNLMQPIKLTANTALCLTSTTVTTHSVTISGFIAPS